MTNFMVTTILPGTPEDERLQDELARQRQAERERANAAGKAMLRRREEEQRKNSEALARRMTEIAAIEKQMKIEAQQQADNLRRIEAGELTPFEIGGHPVHRVDFIQLPDGSVKVSKINRDEHRKQDYVLSVETKPVDMEAARAWLTEHGYICRQWDGGMRAWFGRLWPIRTRDEIQSMRARANKSVERGTNTGNTTVLDFAYDC